MPKKKAWPVLFHFELKWKNRCLILDNVLHKHLGMYFYHYHDSRVYFSTVSLKSRVSKTVDFGHVELLEFKELENEKASEMLVPHMSSETTTSTNAPTSSTSSNTSRTTM